MPPPDPTTPAPRATYRLQLTGDFGFADAEKLVPYLRDLGISHLYLSPCLQARAGSTHGYDVVDPRRVSEDLGGEEALRALAAAARAEGLGVILDIVPNHMATDDANPFWSDEHERRRVFDLDPVTGAHRRFFSIGELAGVRQEDPDVFAETHAKIFELLAGGLLDGLRIDHPDGLADPAGYLRRLREHGAGRVWVEKILHPGERLRAWPVAGTVGYEYLVDSDALFCDPVGEAAITAAYQETAGERRAFDDVAQQARREQVDKTFVPEIERLRRLADLPGVDHALVHLPVYRTYADPATGTVTDADRDAVAASGAPPELARVLTLDDTGTAPPEFVSRFQQTSPAVVAKGVEDTAFYRWVRLLAHNEVGGDPGRFSIDVERFHEANRRRLAEWPDSLLAATTHDTKRSADVRARLVALTTMADAFATRVRAWEQLTADLVEDGAPDGNERWYLFQTLIGAWPIDRDRLTDHVRKALREAGVHTDWVGGDESWEQRVIGFADRLLASPSFLADFEPFARDVAAAGERISLAQTLLRLTVPGVPDVYQGDEVWNLALTDPDNRRPVDHGPIAAALAGLRGGEPVTPGTAKLDLIRRVLGLRAQRPRLFADGAYTPVDVGPDVCAFWRGTHEVLVVAFLRPPGTAPADAPIELPGRTWFDVLHGYPVAHDAATPRSLADDRGLALLVPHET
ncbi:MAG: malto-oligosyltrehalose synthase [Actinobacteria bacterium]|nr:malto-oligosyltrehalose synthase [Actinomycetota bacterium]